MFAAGLSRLLIAIAFALAASGLVACGGGQQVTVCAPGLYLYQGGCLTAASQNFATCTRDRGQNLSQEDRAKIEASVDVGIKGGGAIVDISRKVVETELPDVAMEVVRNCLELSKSFANPAEQTAIDRTLENMIRDVTKGTISLEPKRGPYDQVIVVTGTDWPPNIEMEVAAGFSQERAMTDDDGNFHASITLDPRSESTSPSKVTIRVKPVEMSTQVGASALYEIVK